MKDINYITEPVMLSKITKRSQTLSFRMSSEPLLGGLLKILVTSKRSG